MRNNADAIIAGLVGFAAAAIWLAYPIVIAPDTAVRTEAQTAHKS